MAAHNIAWLQHWRRRKVRIFKIDDPRDYHDRCWCLTNGDHLHDMVALDFDHAIFLLPAMLGLDPIYEWSVESLMSEQSQ